MSIGIIIQARTTSTRLPKKVVLPFYQEKSIVEIIIEKIKSTTNFPVILATTVNESDDILINLAEKSGTKYYRGSETNVLERFINCAEEYKLSSIVRVCADNPFLDTSLMKELIDSHIEFKADYTSFKTSNGIPAIKTHFGLFTEVVENESLKKVRNSTNDVLFTEHVTNYIYAHPDLFKLNLITMPEYIENSGTRFTLDTIEDWNLLSPIYKELMLIKPNFNSYDLIKTIEGKNEVLNIMKSQIEKFSK